MNRLNVVEEIDIYDRNMNVVDEEAADAFEDKTTEPGALTGGNLPVKEVFLFGKPFLDGKNFLVSKRIPFGKRFPVGKPFPVGQRIP